MARKYRPMPTIGAYRHNVITKLRPEEKEILLYNTPIIETTTL